MTDRPKPENPELTRKIEAEKQQAGGKCPTGEKTSVRYCPSCKWKLNPHTPKICPQCNVDLMRLIWEENDRMQESCYQWRHRAESYETAIDNLREQRDSWMQQAEARTAAGEDAGKWTLKLTQENDRLTRRLAETERVRDERWAMAKDSDAQVIRLEHQLAAANKTITENWGIDEENARLRRQRDEAAAAIDELGRALFGISETTDTSWRETKAPWWQRCKRAAEAVEAERLSTGDAGEG